MRGPAFALFLPQKPSPGASAPSAAAPATRGTGFDDATVVGDWWLDGLVPCLLARAAAPLPQYLEPSWNFDLHGAARYTLCHAEARTWRRAGHHADRCVCDVLRDCPFDRYLRLADVSGFSDDSD